MNSFNPKQKWLNILKPYKAFEDFFFQVLPVLLNLFYKNKISLSFNLYKVAVMLEHLRCSVATSTVGCMWKFWNNYNNIHLTVVCMLQHNRTYYNYRYIKIWKIECPLKWATLLINDINLRTKVINWFTLKIKIDNWQLSISPGHFPI